MAEEERSVRTKLPTDIEEDQPFLSVLSLQLSLRQLLTIIAAVLFWVALMQLTSAIIGLNPIFSGILWSWVFFGGVFIALRKKDGLPYEEYLAQRIIFLISDKRYVLRDEEKSASIEEADWDTLEEESYLYWDPEGKNK